MSYIYIYIYISKEMMSVSSVRAHVTTDTTDSVY